MNLKQKITGQYLYSLISRVLMIGMKIVFTFFLIHHLSEHLYGFYGVIVSVLGIWVSLVDLGWGDYMRREIPALSAEDQKLILKNSSTAHLVFNFLLIGIAALVWKSGIIPSLDHFIPSVSFFLLCALLFTLAGYFPLIQIYLNYSKSIEAFNQLLILQMGTWIALLFAWRLTSPIHVDSVLISWCISYGITYSYFWIRHSFLFTIHVSKGFLSKSLKFGFPLCALGTGQEFLQNYDRYLLGAFTSFAEVAPYHLFNNIIDVAERANQITLHPYIFQAHDENQISRRNRLMTSLLKTRIALQVLGIVVGGLAIFMIPRLLPEYYRSSLPLFFLIGFVSMLRSTTQTLYLSLLLEKKTYWLAFSNAIGLIVSIPLNLKLIPIYHAYGAALSLLISTLVTTAFQLSVIKIWKYLDKDHFFSWKAEAELLKDWLQGLKLRKK